MLLLLILCTSYVANCADILVTIDDGTLQGYTANDYYGNPYYGFQSVPYAQPPINKLRFQPSLPAKPWSGILNASIKNPVCPQWKNNINLVGSEDCLYLHVYTNSLSADNLKRPVMVWIHGGALVEGSAYEGYGPEFLVAENVVLVSVQYRLGQLGFLSVDKPELPSNLGFKDQVLALKWVQKNIHHFGGDSNQVTIFGESAGAMSVHALVMSPMGKGLFQKAIVQSGFADLIVDSTASNTSIGFFQHLKCNYSSMVKLLPCLYNKTTEQLLLADLQLRTGAKISDQGYDIPGLIIESNPETGFISKPIKTILKSGYYNQVPMMMGTVADDGALALFKKPRAPPNVTDYEMFIPYNIPVKHGSKESKKLGNKIKTLYYENKLPLFLCDEWIRYQTDNMFLRSMYQYAQMHVNISNQPVYFYQFNYTTELNKNVIDYYRPIVMHGDDNRYLFASNKTPKHMDSKSNEYIGVHRMIKFWTTFAKSKNDDPNIDNDPLVTAKWNKFDSKMTNYMYLSPNLQEMKHLAKDRMDFWDEIYSQYQTLKLYV